MHDLLNFAMHGQSHICDRKSVTGEILRSWYSNLIGNAENLHISLKGSSICAGVFSVLFPRKKFCLPGKSRYWKLTNQSLHKGSQRKVVQYGYSLVYWYKRTSHKYSRVRCFDKVTTTVEVVKWGNITTLGLSLISAYVRLYSAPVNRNRAPVSQNIVPVSLISLNITDLTVVALSYMGL